jgi:hypothetical protein
MPSDMQVALTEDERWYVSLALASFIETSHNTPELCLDDLTELHSKFLMPSDIAA